MPVREEEKLKKKKQKRVDVAVLNVTSNRRGKINFVLLRAIVKNPDQGCRLEITIIYKSLTTFEE